MAHLSRHLRVLFVVAMVLGASTAAFASGGGDPTDPSSAGILSALLQLLTDCVNGLVAPFGT